MASRAGHCEVAEFLLQNTAPVDAKAKVQRSSTHTDMFFNSFILLEMSSLTSISCYKISNGTVMCSVMNIAIGRSFVSYRLLMVSNSQTPLLIKQQYTQQTTYNFRFLFVCFCCDLFLFSSAILLHDYNKL